MATTFKSRSGRELTIYTFKAGGDRPIHGAYKCEGYWMPCSWDADGFAFEGQKHPLDINWDVVVEPDYA